MSNQATEKKKKKVIPEIDIPETTTKAAPAIVIENYPTEKDEKTTDKNGAPPPPPDERCPAHLDSCTVLSPPTRADAAQHTADTSPRLPFAPAPLS